MTVPNREIRRTILDMLNAGAASHLGSAFSMVEILNSVFKNTNIEKIKNADPGRDRVVLSKGHGTSGLYAVMFHHGLLSEAEIRTYFKNESMLAGHASHFIPQVEHSTGALGHGLSASVGMALGLRSKKLPGKVFVIVGDGELHEGSNWEAIMLAGHVKLSNLFVLVDNNRRAQMGITDEAVSLDPLPDKFSSFNFEVLQVPNGHDEEAISAAIAKGAKSPKPTAILCDTVKGKGVSFMEGDNLWHYRPPMGTDYANAVAEISRGE